MSFKEFLSKNIVYLDGGMGTLLQKQGLPSGEHPERWNITHPDVIVKIHRDYFDKGSNIVCTNTFGANGIKFSDEELENIIKAAVENAKKARQQSSCKKEKFIALDIGPSGKLLKPLGDLDFEDAVTLFAKTVKLGVKHGVDLIVIETMTDSYETKAALLAAKENSDLPVIVTNAYGEDGKLMTGATPCTMVAMLEGMGVDALGANCSLGPKQLMSVADELLKYASVPVVMNPNAGLPKSVGGNTVFDVLPDEFADDIATLIQKGVRVVGGCCGTTPEYIGAVCNKTEGIAPKTCENKNYTLVSSYTHAVLFGDSPILIGERINPTGKKRFKQALIDNDLDYILSEGISQQEKGVHILDVNVGLPEVDEALMLEKVLSELQSVSDLPLQIDTSDTEAMEKALRRYNGKAMINSVNGKSESMSAVFPLVKKYGGVVVALTLDEQGIPDSAEGRFQIASRIVNEAAKYGIDKKDIVFDTLAMTISADNKAATVTLDALEKIKKQLGCHTSLGVSNVSFGLPNRDAVNSVFFTMALEKGLSAAIMNPYSADMMKSYYTYKALKGLDENCSDYVEKVPQLISVAATPAEAVKNREDFGSDLQKAIIKGFKDKAKELTKQLIKSTSPLDLVNSEIIPALNTVGIGFENKTVYLPQLLMSAEAAKSAFEVIKEGMLGSGANQSKGKILIATVEGDIHDIGKNIVKLILENYGFGVVDLGKDVPAEKIVEKAIELHADVVGLSALMTTTVPSMERTIALLKDSAPWCKTIVGGAVLTQAYADKIGADYYAKDAMEAVRIAERII
ncbi:MAG: homocysteine S-methyltransferase family protein [Clostridia bacterium]|nr:homocysteine S-methyltransferase family protein [Clostridia bacterium]